MFKLYFVAFTVVLLFGVSWVSSENTVSPDSENDSDTLAAFSAALERYSGLDTNPPSYKISGIECPTLTECIVDPRGTIVWDIREDLYTQHMMQSVAKGADNTTTIDGCLQYYAENLTGYLDCMTTVRNKMITYLDANFENSFRTMLQSNCSLLVDNCYTASSS